MLLLRVEITSFSFSMPGAPRRLGIRDVERFLRREDRCVVSDHCRAMKEEARPGTCPVLEHNEGLGWGCDLLAGWLHIWCLCWVTTITR